MIDSLDGTCEQPIWVGQDPGAVEVVGHRRGAAQAYESSHSAQYESGCSVVHLRLYCSSLLAPAGGVSRTSQSMESDGGEQTAKYCATPLGGTTPIYLVQLGSTQSGKI